MTFDLWDSLPIVIYAKPGVTVQVDLEDGCSDPQSHHYQVYAGLAAGFAIDNFNITIPYINKPVSGLGRPVLPFGQEFGIFG